MNMSSSLSSLFILLLALFLVLPCSAIQNNTPNQTSINAGPDYEIPDILLPVQSSWIEPGTYIHPNITIKNAGSDDVGTQPIEIQAQLGRYQLVSKNNLVASFKAGETRLITPDYLIPNGVPSGEYSLIVSINSYHNQNGTVTGVQASPKDTINVRMITPKAKTSACSCS